MATASRVPSRGKIDPNVQKLYNQITKQRAQLAGLGGQVPSHGHPSILSRVFDVISRPNYAMAGAFGHAYDELEKSKGTGKGFNQPAAMGAGFLRGLAGKDKYHFADVMAKAAQAKAPGSSLFKNRVVRGVGGLAADILTDPTTYMGIGVTKAIPGIEAGVEASKAMQAAQAGVKGANAVEKVPKLLQVGAEARAAAEAARPGSIALKMFGKPVLESERAYSGAAKVLRPVASSKLGQGLNEAFRLEAYYPGKMKEMLRVPMSRNAAELDRVNKGLIQEWSAIPKTERIRAAKALDRGQMLHGVLSSSGHDLGEFQDAFVRAAAERTNSEITAGISRAQHAQAEHVPKILPYTGEYKGSAARALRRDEERAIKEAQVLASGKKLKKLTTKPTFESYAMEGLKPEDDLLNIWQLENSIHVRRMAKAELKNAALAEYGVKFAGKNQKANQLAHEAAGWKNLANHPELLRDSKFAGQTIHAPKEVVKMLEHIDEFYNAPAAANKFVGLIDRMTRLWKNQVTALRPGHHTRDLFGDAFLNWQDGVQLPSDYARGMKVVRGKGGDMVIGNVRKSIADIANDYHLSGAGAQMARTELQTGARVGLGEGGGVGQILGVPNKIGEFARGVENTRSDWMRMTNFTHKLRKYAVEHGVTNEAEYQKAVEYASKAVRKANFDYGALTPFEQRIMRRYMPFYTFMRKNIPRQVEMIAMHPGKMSQVPKGMAAMEQLLGTDRDHLPVTEVLPAWMKDAASVRLAGEGEGGLLHKLFGGTNPFYTEPNIPTSDISRTFTGSPAEVIRKSLGQTNPIIKGLIELGMQKSTLSGAPISKSVPSYVAEQIPLNSLRQQIMSPHKPTRLIMPGERTTVTPAEAIANFMGAGIQEITGQKELSELRRQQDPVQARLRKLRTDMRNQALRGHTKKAKPKRR